MNMEVRGQFVRDYFLLIPYRVLELNKDHQALDISPLPTE